MILYDHVNLEITNSWYIESDKKNGKPNKHFRKVGSVTLDGLIESKKIDKLVETVLDICTISFHDGVNEVVLTTKTTDGFN